MNVRAGAGFADLHIVLQLAPQQAGRLWESCSPSLGFPLPLFPNGHHSSTLSGVTAAEGMAQISKIELKYGFTPHQLFTIMSSF